MGRAAGLLAVCGARTSSLGLAFEDRGGNSEPFGDRRRLAEIRRRSEIAGTFGDRQGLTEPFRVFRCGNEDPGGVRNTSNPVGQDGPMGPAGRCTRNHPLPIVVDATMRPREVLYHCTLATIVSSVCQ